jgi:hypothetical protein
MGLTAFVSFLVLLYNADWCGMNAMNAMDEMNAGFVVYCVVYCGGVLCGVLCGVLWWCIVVVYCVVYYDGGGNLV